MNMTEYQSPSQVDEWGNPLSEADAPNYPRRRAAVAAGFLASATLVTGAFVACERASEPDTLVGCATEPIGEDLALGATNKAIEEIREDSPDFTPTFDTSTTMAAERFNIVQGGEILKVCAYDGLTDYVTVEDASPTAIPRG